MRQKLNPWIAAIFCAILSLITIVGDLATRFLTGMPGGANMVFLCFIPMCFFFVGAFLTELRKENEELRQKIQELSAK